MSLTIRLQWFIFCGLPSLAACCGAPIEEFSMDFERRGFGWAETGFAAMAMRWRCGSGGGDVGSSRSPLAGSLGSQKIAVRAMASAVF